ncbi:hypothetical protein KMAL_07570 [Novacetimonas maltaceti]|uniref:Uncharacterized protein n=1 Tax=Novacetimonas maltaceti TaxID=1203393 RepID=A0A2S3W431_9PROT|nr:hypothetical protein KMAL_07570 [Novacetimonas maltaceti]
MKSIPIPSLRWRTRQVGGREGRWTWYAWWRCVMTSRSRGPGVGPVPVTLPDGQDMFQKAVWKLPIIAKPAPTKYEAEEPEIWVPRMPV